jgi:branched-chain amino acid transport system ATP-binding protein
MTAPVGTNGSPILEISEVAVRFGGVAALDGVTFDVLHDQVLGVIGPNGAGKTTLLNVISGFVRPSRGRVLLEGNEIARRSPADRARRGLGRTFQTPRLFPRLTVAENLVVAQRQRKRSHATLGSITDILELVGILDLAEVESERLTSGERRFAEIARTLILAPAVLLLDEPGTGLRDSEIQTLSDLLNQLRNDHDLSALVISHNMDIVTNCCSDVIVMDAGRVIARGTPAEIRRDPVVVQAYFGSEEISA